ATPQCWNPNLFQAFPMLEAQFIPGAKDGLSCAASVARARSIWQIEALFMTQVEPEMPAKSRSRKPAAKPQRKPPARKASARKPPVRKAARSRERTQAPKGKWVYAFGGGKAEGRAGMKNLLGGKGAGLAEMANLGLPVPPGFTITTDVCTYFYAYRKSYPSDLELQVSAALERLGKIVGKRFGDAKDPLLVSVRSGARASMPGMMDTVLNLGLNDETVEALAQQSGDRRFAYRRHRRFLPH